MDNVDRVREKVDIVDLLNSYIPLKKAGKNYKANCPFHSEKTASFMVSPDIQRYRCFGCEKSGDIFNFVMEMEGVDFSEALKILAKRAGVTLESSHSKTESQQDSKKQLVIELNELAAQFYQKLLTGHEYGKPALEYLKKRNVSKESISTFRLGYAPKSWNSLSLFLQKKGYKSDDIVLAGLAKYREGRNELYDMFRGRLMFALIDHLNRVVGFSGRSLSADQEPKYINTPETPVYHKERYVYGLQVAKTAIRQSRIAVIVEGYFDMMSPYQEGIKNVVATAGTALTPGQLALIKRYADEVVLVFDSDSAGVAASLRGVDVVESSGLSLSIVSLPEAYKDPDEIVQKDPQLFKELIKDAVALWDYYFVYALKTFSLSDSHERKKASDFLLSRIKTIPDKVMQAQYCKKFAELFEVDESVVVERLNDMPVEKSPAYAFPRALKSPESVIRAEGKEPIAQELYFLALVTELPVQKRTFFLSEANDQLFETEPVQVLFRELKKAYEENENLEISRFYATLQDTFPESKHLFERMYLFDVVGSREEDLRDLSALEKECAVTLYRLQKGYHTRELSRIAKMLTHAEATQDTAHVASLEKEAKSHAEALSNLPSL